MGTDGNGMDVFSRVISSPRTDLVIALLATLGAIGVGVPLGLIAGYFRGFFSEALMRLSDIVQSFPVFLLGMTLVVITGQDIKNVIYVVAFVNCPIYIRLTRSQVLFLRERTFIEAARAMGCPHPWVLREHLFPNAIGPAVANASVTMGWAILLTAGLSFIGAGVRVPTPEWGSMIAVGAKNIYTGEWWASVFPGVALATTVLGFALMGDALARFADVTRR
jgi:peptide/nickel transport system permease protein